MAVIHRVQGYLLVDGVPIEPALAWSYEHLPECGPLPLFYGTDYEVLIDQGPLLIPAKPGDSADRYWQQPDSLLRNAVWLESTLPPSRMRSIMQRRLQVYRPSGDAVWLRLYDSRPLLRAYRAGLAFPNGFWHGITSVWLPERTAPFAAWHSLESHDDIAPRDLGISPQIALDWPLLNALANTEMEVQA